LEEFNMTEILQFLESLDTPDLSRVEAFLQSRGVSPEKLRTAYEMLEQLGIRYDGPTQEAPDQKEMLSMFDQLSSSLDNHTRQQLKSKLNGFRTQKAPSAGRRSGASESTRRLNSSEDVLEFLKNMKKE
jgi:uncharacterized protein YecA (UPF0149 family)